MNFLLKNPIVLVLIIVIILIAVILFAKEFKKGVFSKFDVNENKTFSKPVPKLNNMIMQIYDKQENILSNLPV